MTTLADLLTESTHDAELDDLLTRATALGANARGWQSLRVQRVLFELEADGLVEWKKKRVEIVSGGYIDDAVGLWLDLAATWYQELRNPPVYTQGWVTLTDAANAGPFNYGDGELVVCFGPTLAKPLYYRATSSVVLPKGGTATVEVKALEAASAYNVPSGQITTIVAPQKPGVTVANPADPTTGTWITVSGSDAEKDDLLRTRCKAKWGVLGAGGNIDAIIYRILKAGGSNVTRYKVQSNVMGYGTVRAYLANASGPVSIDVATTVTAYLQSQKATGTGNQIAYPATPLVVPVVGTLYAKGNPAAQAEAIERLVALQETYDIGSTVYASQIDDAIVDAASGAFNWVRTSPAADVTAAASDAVIFQPTITVVAS